MNHRTIPVLLGVLALFGAVPEVRADAISASELALGHVMVDQSEFVEGNSAKSMMLALPTAGKLVLNFTDLDFTGALDSFEFGLSDTSSSLSGMINADSMTIDLTRATTLYLDMFARAGLRTGVGLYNIVAFFEPIPQPVPLPASVLSLAGGLGGLLWICRRRRQTIVMSSVA
jgi:hypothetical protein